MSVTPENKRMLEQVFQLLRFSPADVDILTQAYLRWVDHEDNDTLSGADALLGGRADGIFRQWQEIMSSAEQIRSDLTQIRVRT